MKKRLFHRGHNIENSTGEPDGWKTIINGRPIESKLTLVKKSIDWWCDMKAFMPPEKFAGIGSQSQQTAKNSEDYKGFKLMNDSGKPNEWYVFLRGQLLKGSPAAIKKHLDAVLDKLQQK
ncbi:DUF3319 domain-containing protein [Photobacterium sp. SDRW27]|uniref:DUF3319 domain-containing protein n=1 Tax=Photobacterium obscurum TaxID=2829490 RepID=UPI0022440EB0|nr:DUF3319 domain-containing protein [Photobacterium obscurum]MCW8329412.1 DUF3319 domain-containing protein [Photobacterium obscurum]